MLLFVCIHNGAWAGLANNTACGVIVTINFGPVRYVAK